MSVSRPPLLLVGGSPSSGSTLLMNLLMRSPSLLCLPETGLFCHGDELVGAAGDPESRALDGRVAWLDTRAKLGQFNHDLAERYEAQHGSHATSVDLVHAITDVGDRKCIVEKTPENIFAFDRYLRQSSDHRVIVTSRDLVGVVHSLVRRGFTIVESLLAWFAHSYETARLILDHPGQVVHCSYADLVRDPDAMLERIRREVPLPCEQRDFVSGTDGGAHGLAVSGWELGDTAWTRQADGSVQAVESINLLGIALDVVVDTTCFETREHGLVNARNVDSLLSGHDDRIQPVERGADRTPMPAGSLYIESLDRAYPVHRMKGVAC